MSFNELGLSEPLMRAVAELGYETPTPIQQQAIPAVLRGGDLLAGAQTGTGKTAGFALPILELLKKTQKPSPKPVVRTLVLVPTRELAAQVEASFKDYGKYMKLKSMMMFGGVGINPQIDQLRRGVDILVATPGRLLDHMQQGTVDLSHVEILVLDEADRMLDMGFIRDIKRVLAVLPRKRQNLLFSATFSDEIKALADGLLNAPEMIEVARRNTTAEGVAQRVYPVDRERKRELLTHLIRTHKWFQLLVFTRTKHGANRLAEQLNKDGITALAIHGNKSQSARTRALAEFKDATLQVLVATDIAARGIDIDQLPHVINYDLPNVPEDYVHRIGRTGRAGASGEALSLVSIDDKPLLADIEKLIRRSIPTEIVPGFEPDPSILPEPPAARRQGGQRQGQGQGQRGAPKRVAAADAGNARSKPAGRGAASPGRGEGAAAGRGDGRQGQSRTSVSSAGGRMGAADGAVRRDRVDTVRPERKVSGLEPRSGDARGEHRRPVKAGGNPGALLSGSQKR